MSICFSVFNLEFEPSPSMQLGNIYTLIQSEMIMSVKLVLVSVSPPRCVRCCCSSGNKPESLGLICAIWGPRYAWVWSESESRLLSLS